MIVTRYNSKVLLIYLGPLFRVKLKIAKTLQK